MRYGANPDLRDEDGKTPLDKARERNDEGHREVTSILQSPADWLSEATVKHEEEAGQGQQEKEKESQDKEEICQSLEPEQKGILFHRSYVIMVIAESNNQSSLLK